MWYVIQVTTKQEKKTLKRLRRALDAYDSRARSAMCDTSGQLPHPRAEMFIPLREVMRHRNGEWVSTTEIIFPGYIFVSTKDVDGLLVVLKETPDFTKLLGNGEQFVPLADDEVKLINAFGGGDHLVRMSKGVIEGDRVRILGGPLFMHDGIIRKIDRHKRVAYVEMSIMGRKKIIKLGLEVTKKIA